MTSTRKWLGPAAIFGLGALAVAILGGLGTELGPWYRSLEKSVVQPPGWVFGPVWTTLYVIIAVAGAWSWMTVPPGARRGLAALWIANALLNAAWTFVFFTLQQPLAAVVVIAALWLTIVLLMRAIWPRRRGPALLLAPYLVWVSFAAWLNIAIVALN
ncbi:MAG: hypothetical protein TEF_04195 [Rhizobiales bacterium NRL2]|nr:MAG: hypothetical protein TEF_04195 [Rhizobiales bacterium NRL2]